MENIIKGRRRAIWITANDLLCEDGRSELIRVGIKVIKPTKRKEREAAKNNAEKEMNEEMSEENLLPHTRKNKPFLIHKNDRTFRYYENEFDGVLLATYKNLDPADKALHKWLCPRGGTDFNGLVSFCTKSINNAGLELCKLYLRSHLHFRSYLMNVTRQKARPQTMGKK